MSSTTSILCYPRQRKRDYGTQIRGRRVTEGATAGEVPSLEVWKSDGGEQHRMNQEKTLARRPYVIRINYNSIHELIHESLYRISCSFPYGMVVFSHGIVSRCGRCQTRGPCLHRHVRYRVFDRGCTSRRTNVSCASSCRQDCFPVENRQLHGSPSRPIGKAG